MILKWCRILHLLSLKNLKNTHMHTPMMMMIMTMIMDLSLRVEIEECVCVCLIVQLARVVQKSPNWTFWHH